MIQARSASEWILGHFRKIHSLALRACNYDIKIIHGAALRGIGIYTTRFIFLTTSLPSPRSGRAAGVRGAVVGGRTIRRHSRNTCLGFFPRHLTRDNANWLLVPRFPCQSSPRVACLDSRHRRTSDGGLAVVGG